MAKNKEVDGQAPIRAAKGPGRLMAGLAGFWRESGIIGGIRSTFRSSKNGKGLMSSAFGAAIDTARAAATPGATEEFGEAMERYSLTEEQLPGLHNQNVIEALIQIVFVALGLGLMVLFWQMRGGPGFEHVVIFILTLAFLARAGSKSFNAFRVRRRRLGGLREWALSPAEWLPGFMHDPVAERKAQRKRAGAQ